MKLVRYLRDEKIGCGILEGDLIHPVEDPFTQKRAGRKFEMVQAKLLAPAAPTKIICAGLNYKDHAAEMNMPLPAEPVIFLKPPSSVVGPGDQIRYPEMSHQVDYEAELAVVIGREASSVQPSEARGFVLGYTCFNDVTARDLQRRDGQWTRAKSFDTFSPMGPWIDTEFEPYDAKVEAYLNGEMRQSSSTANMIFKVDELVSFISRVMTLYPGDVIATGTPPGIGPMRVDDEVEIRIQGLGRLINTVAG